MADRGRRNPRHACRYADRGNGDIQRDPCDVEEIARLRQRIRDLEPLNKEYFDEEMETDSVIWDGETDPRNPFTPNYQPHHHYDRQQPPADSLRNLGIKIELPEFDGQAQPDDFLEWLHTVERVFDLRDIPDKYKVKLMAIKLRKYVSLWWEHVTKKRAQEGRSRVTTWSKMKKLLKENFCHQTIDMMHSLKTTIYLNEQPLLKT
jgi:hypothetical protein